MTSLTIDEAAFKVLAKKALEECREEWKRVWHNGTIKDFPDVSDEEWETFNFRLDHYVHQNIEDVKTDIKKKFNLAVEVFSDGRSGATFYIDEYNIGRDYTRHSLNEENITGCDDMDDIDYYGISWWDVQQRTENFLKALKYFNKQIRAYAANVKDWWAEEREYLIEEGILETEEA